MRNNYNERLQRTKNKKMKEKSLQDAYVVKRPDGKVTKKMPYNKAIEISRKYPNSIVEKN
jgi:hypothetical protein